GAREQIWDGPRAPASEPQDRKPSHPGSDARPAKPAELRDDISPTGWLGPLIIVGLALLAIGGFVGHWWGAGAVAQVQLQAQLDIAKAKTEGAQLTLASLHSDLLGVLRDTLGDEALRKPLAQAITELDHVLAALPADSAPSAGSAAAG